MEEEPLFTLPKGLVVREASASGAGWFEPYRFRLVITSDDPNLVNYSSEDVPTDRAEYYSAEVDRNRELQELYGDGAR